MAAFRLGDASRLLSWTNEQVSAAVEDGMVVPGGAPDEPLFDLREVVALRGVAALQARGAVDTTIEEALQQFRDALPAGASLPATRLDATANPVPRPFGPIWDLAIQRPRVDRGYMDRSRAKTAWVEPKAMDASDWFELGADEEATDLELAVTHYSDALRLDPGHPGALVNLGRVHQQAGRLPEARRCYEHALVRDPSQTIAQFNRGTLAESDGDAAAAVTAYRTALVSAPTFADARYNLGRLLWLGDQHDGAIEALRPMLAPEPGSGA